MKDTFTGIRNRRRVLELGAGTLVQIPTDPEHRFRLIANTRSD